MLRAENGKRGRAVQQRHGHSNHSISPQGMSQTPHAQGRKSPKERGIGSPEKLDLVLGVFCWFFYSGSVLSGSNAHEGSCEKAAGAAGYSPNTSWQRSIQQRPPR